MSIEFLDITKAVPYNREILVRTGGEEFADYMEELVDALQFERLLPIEDVVNLMLQLQNTQVWYSRLPNASGVYPNGTWRIQENDDGELEICKKVSDNWVIYAAWGD